MVDFRAVTRDHLLTALEEYDAAGGDALLALHGRSDEPDHVLRHQGRRYDAKVVAGLAYMRATRAAASPEELFRGRHNAAEVIPDLGFDLTVPAPPPPPEPSARSCPPATRPAATRSARSTASGVRSTGLPAATRRTVREEPPAKICPSCFLALPATGVCDDCD